MPAARQIKGDRPLKDLAQAVKLLVVERERVKLTANAHHTLARRIRPETTILSGERATGQKDVGTLRLYLPWAQALGLQMTLVDGDVEQTMNGREDLVAFVYAALKRRGLTMEDHIRDGRTAGAKGFRAFKEMKMSTAKDIWLGSLLKQAELIGFTIILRTP